MNEYRLGREELMVEIRELLLRLHEHANGRHNYYVYALRQIEELIK